MWDERYSGEDFAYGTAPNDFLVEAVQYLPPKGRVLCLADGEGRNSVYLAEQGFEVVGVDSSPVGLTKAEKLAKERNVKIETVLADLADFEIKADSFNAVISIFCHLLPGIMEKVHKQIVRGLRKGGVLVLEGYTPRQHEYNTGGPKSKEVLMNLVTLKKEFSGLEFKHAKEIDREIHEGQFHNGMSAVVQIIAVKQ